MDNSNKSMSRHRRLYDRKFIWRPRRFQLFRARYLRSNRLPVYSCVLPVYLPSAEEIEDFRK